MTAYKDMTLDQRRAEYAALQTAFADLKAQGLKLDMTRGKPCKDQLDMVSDIFDTLNKPEDFIVAGIDIRNYGALSGLPEAKRLFANLLDCKPKQVFVGGNASLQLMYGVIDCAFIHGRLNSPRPWCKEPVVKWLCPAPGYDRHFAITERFGVEMVPVPMTGHGPDMDTVEALVQSDASIKGMWCVPKYSNPTGETYSGETVRRIASLRPAAPDFRVFWDMAYALHDLDDTPDELLNIFALTRGTENENLGFFSTSKITYAGAGVAMMISGADNVKRARAEIAYQTISPDKMNQLRHARYLASADNVRALMRRHASVLKPKFDTVTRVFREEFSDCGFASWTEPHGGYFLSLDVLPGTARRTVELCKNVGVTLTPAGSTSPYPEDKNIRIAPSYPELHELETAMGVVCTCAKLAAAEKLLEQTNA